MNEPAVRAVIRRHVGPAFDGCPQTTVPVLWRLQKAFAELYGEEQAIELLEDFNLLNGRSAEAYVLQEAGISSGLYNTLIQGNKSRGMDLQRMVQIDPKAARYAVQRLEEDGNWAQVKETTLEKAGLRAPIRSAQVSQGTNSDALIGLIAVIGLIALMAWLLMTIG